MKVFGMSIQEQASANSDLIRGAQYDLVVQGSGFLLIVGSGVALALMAIYPPTAEIGTVGWALVVPTSILAMVLGGFRVTLKHRPSLATIHAGSFMGIAQVALLLWLAGGGKAPYMQMLLLPVLGAAVGQPVRSCAWVLIAATAAALSPLLYSSIDVLAIVTEFSLLSTMTLMTAIVIASTRAHRARLKDAGEQANTLAHVDPLTGMPNRRAFDDGLVHAAESVRLDSTPVSLVLCDVNSFKPINDAFGHAAGDEVLRSIAKALSDAVRKPDVAFRWAGDEFAVILRDTDEENASRVAARLREAVKRQCRRPDGRGVTIGTGVAELHPSMSTDEVLMGADRALFSQKEAQRNHLRSTA